MQLNIIQLLIFASVLSTIVMFTMYSSKTIDFKDKMVDSNWRKIYIGNIQSEMEKAGKDLNIDLQYINSALESIVPVDSSRSMPSSDMTNLQTSLFTRQVSDIVANNVSSDGSIGNRRRQGILLKPIFGTHRNTEDAIFSTCLSDYHDPQTYKAFVGSLRQHGFTGDIVLALLPESKSYEQVESYLSTRNVVGYPYPVVCEKRDSNCEFAPHRIRRDSSARWNLVQRSRWIVENELYEYWLSQYSSSSVVMVAPSVKPIVFQANPFSLLGRDKLTVFQSDVQKIKDVFPAKIHEHFGDCGTMNIFDKFKSEGVVRSNLVVGRNDLVGMFLRVQSDLGTEMKCWSGKRESSVAIGSYLYYSGVVSRLVGEGKIDTVSDSGSLLRWVPGGAHQTLRKSIEYDNNGLVLSSKDKLPSAIVVNWQLLPSKYLLEYVQSTSDLKGQSFGSSSSSLAVDKAPFKKRNKRGRKALKSSSHNKGEEFLDGKNLIPPNARSMQAVDTMGGDPGKAPLKRRNRKNQKALTSFSEKREYLQDRNSLVPSDLASESVAKTKIIPSVAAGGDPGKAPLKKQSRKKHKALAPSSDKREDLQDGNSLVPSDLASESVAETKIIPSIAAGGDPSKAPLKRTRREKVAQSLHKKQKIMQQGRESARQDNL